MIAEADKERLCSGLRGRNQTSYNILWNRLDIDLAAMSGMCRRNLIK